MADFLLILPILLLSVVAHEYAHAWTAYRQGDDTAHALGRLTFNPIPHIDLFSSILLPVLLWFASKGAFTFGSAKPVPINPAKFRHYVRGDIIVSLAGIVMNVLIAVACGGIFMLLGTMGRALPGVDVFKTLQYMAAVGLGLNVLLAMFNLIPLPPLDGSHLLFHALPAKIGARYQQFGRFGFLILILSLWVAPGVWTTLLRPVDAIAGSAMTFLAPWSLGPHR